MGWLRMCGEFVGSATAAFVRTRTKLKQEKLVQPDDYCVTETKLFIQETLKTCRPADQHITGKGRRIIKSFLDRNDYFGSMLAIDTNTQSTKRKICIVALQTAAKCICYGTNVDALRAATYSYLLVQYGGFD